VARVDRRGQGDGKRLVSVARFPWGLVPSGSRRHGSIQRTNGIWSLLHRNAGSASTNGTGGAPGEKPPYHCPAAGCMMSERTFIDHLGNQWQAWDVQPVDHAGWSAARRHLPETMADGWLCFESASEKRRVHPIPKGWESGTLEDLRNYCRSAESVQPRPGTAGGDSIMDPISPSA
jgi:hypothetical protein